MKNADLPAFPVEIFLSGETPEGKETGNGTGFTIGLTKHEAYVLGAMIGMLASGQQYDAQQAVAHATETLDALDSVGS